MATHAAAVLGGTQPEHRPRPRFLCPPCPLPVEHASDFWRGTIVFPHLCFGLRFPFFLGLDAFVTTSCSLTVNPFSAA